MTDCRQWLWSQLLLHGPISYKKVKKKAIDIGFTNSELRAAKKSLCMITAHVGNDWLWRLPNERG